MKKLIGMLLLGFSLPAAAQTFSCTTSGGIPDNGPEVCFSFPVSGLPAQIDASFGLTQACVNITHSYVGDLVVRLKTPSGTFIKLIDRAGGSGDNFTNTCLQNNATSGIANGGAPWTGSYLPAQPLSLANNGQNPNGTWQLCVQDQAGADIGIFNSCTITFGTNPPPPPPPPPAPCGLTNPTGCQCPIAGQTDCDLLPDMTASGLIIQQEHTELPGQIRLSNATPNIGWGPLEVQPTSNCFCDSVQVPCSTVVCPGGGFPKQQINQRIYHRNNGTMTTYDRPAGFMSYHPSHGHIHVDNWAEFTLRTPTADPDARNWPILGTGTKVSFCLINLGNCTSNYGYCLDAAGNIITMANIPNAPFGEVSGCGTTQGIYTGHLDIYSQGMDGMSIDLTGICNGNYYIVSVTDPDNNFLESDENNNWTAVPITLTQQIAAAPASFTYSAIGGQYAFAGTVPPGNTYSWDFGDGAIDTTYNPTIHSFPGPGTYTVTLSSTGPCGNTTAQQTITVLVSGNEETATFLDYQLTAFPNPSSGLFTARYTLPERSQVQLEVFDLVGKHIRTVVSASLEAGSYDQQIDTKALGLASGSYVLRLKTPQAAMSVRLVVVE